MPSPYHFISDNLMSSYMYAGEVNPGYKGDYDRGEIINTMTTSFVALTAIYFPSVTGRHFAPSHINKKTEKEKPNN